MKKYVFCIIFLFIVLAIIPCSHGNLNKDVLHCLAEKIAWDCDNQHIYLSFDIKQKLGLNEGEKVTDNSIDIIQKSIEIIEKEVIGVKPQETKSYSEATWFIKCDNKKLQYFNDFFWDGNKIYDFCPKVNQTILEQNFLKFEPSISFFSLSPFSINLFPITIIGGLGILFFINKKYNFINIKINLFKKDKK